jgi:hypothetical protein
LKGLNYSAPLGVYPSTLPPDSIQHASETYMFHFVDIPIKLKVYAGKKKVKFVGGAGVVLNICFGQTNILDNTQNGKTLYHAEHTYLPLPKGPQTFTASAIASVGVDYRINDLMGIRVEPQFSHQFIAFSRGGIKSYLWTTGINLAYYFGVK